MKAIFSALLSLAVLTAQADAFIRFEENGKVGVKNESGAIIIPATFQELGWSDGHFSVIGNVTGYRKDNQWGLINLRKEFITPAVFESLVYGGGENVIVRKKINPAHTKTGCINLAGQEKIPFIFDGISISGLRAIVFNLNRGHYQFGLRDLENQEVIETKYRSISPLGSLRFAVQNESGKIALFSDAGKPISDFMIDSISNFHKSYAIIYQNLKQGLIDRNGSVVLEPIYKSIEIIDIGRVRVSLPDEWLMVNSKNEVINKIAVTSLVSVEKYYIIGESGRAGVVDYNFQPIIKMEYGQLMRLPRVGWLAQKNHRYGVLDETGNVKIPLAYDTIVLTGNRYIVKTVQGWSLLNEYGKAVSYKNYTALLTAPDFPLLYARDRHYWGMINEAGDEVVHCVFDSIQQILHNRLVVKFKNQFGVINTQEDWIIAPQPHPITLLSDSLYLLHTPDNVFLKRLNGEILYFTNNTYRLEKDYWVEILPDGTEKTIDYEGRILKRLSTIDRIQKIFHESEGFTGIQRDGKFGFVDDRGRLRIANRYDSIHDFHEGLAAVKLIGRWGFINTDDKVVINPNYDEVNAFKNGHVIVSRNKNWGIINKDAKPILSFQYDNISRLPSGNYSLMSNGRYGLADSQGRILIEPRFDFLEESKHDLVIVNREGKYGVISLQGMSVIPLEYSRIIYNEAANLFLANRKSEPKEISLN